MLTVFLGHITYTNVYKNRSRKNKPEYSKIAQIFIKIVSKNGPGNQRVASRKDCSFLKDVPNEMLTFDAGDPKTESKRNPKSLEIEVGKRFSEMFPKWILLGVHFGSKKRPKRKL